MALKPLALAAVLAAVSSTAYLLAAEDSFVEISELMDAGWKPSSKGLEAARERYEALRADGKLSPAVTYAYALVQMRNRRYADATRLLDQVLATDKNHTAARRAKVWVSMVGQNYDAALVELEKLAKNLPVEKADARSEADAAPDSGAEFIGRVMGFVDGPAASAVAGQTRADYRKRLVAPLTPTQRQAFEQGYNAVTRRFAELDLDRQQTKADAKASQEERQEITRKELEQERANLAQEKTNLQSRAEKVEADFKRELTDLDAQVRPLITRQTRLEAQGAAITREMAGIQVEIARLLELADLAEDPVDAARFSAEARRLDAALVRYDIDLRTVNRDLAEVAAARVALAARRRTAIARQQSETDRLDRRATQVRNTEKRIGVEEKRASRPVAGNTAAVASLSAKARAFSTYEDFPFEEERARLLQSLNPEP
jgi:hypothetical protein